VVVGGSWKGHIFCAYLFYPLFPVARFVGMIQRLKTSFYREYC